MALEALRCRQALLLVRYLGSLAPLPCEKQFLHFLFTVVSESMAQTHRCLSYGGPYKQPFGDCAIYSETTVHCLPFCLAVVVFGV